MKIKIFNKKLFDITSTIFLGVALILFVFYLYWLIILNPRAKTWCQKWASDYFQPLSEEKYQYRYDNCIIASNLKNQLKLFSDSVFKGKNIKIDWSNGRIWPR